MHEFDAAGIAVYALSYDEADALSDFADAQGISYTLLSDPESSVIRSFGILNTLIDENDHPWFGIPYPGTYIINEAGVITHKFFDNNLAVRAGPEQLLGAALGQSVSDQTATGQTATDQTATEGTPVNDRASQGVELNVRLDGEHLTTTVQRDLVFSLSVPANRHVYADPAPEGSVAIGVVLDDDKQIVRRPLVLPASDDHQLAGTKEVFQVHHGLVELRLPLTLNSAIDPEAESVTLSGEVCWQTCDDTVCDIPERQRFEITVPMVLGPAVALRGGAPSELEPNAGAHFAKMSSRRKS